MPKAKPKTKVVRQRVVLGLDLYDYKDLGPNSQAIYDTCMAHQATFSSIAALLATLLARIQAYTLSQQQLNNGQGTAEERNLEASRLGSCLESLRTNVQLLCDQSPDQAATLAAAAGMKLRKRPARTKLPIEAVQVKPGTTVHLEANVGLLTADIKGRVTFNWQFTSDGGKTWINAPSTPHGRTDVAGLQAMQTYGFRVNVTSAAGDTEWCQMVSLLVT
jgi:hypothetical protein